MEKTIKFLKEGVPSKSGTYLVLTAKGWLTDMEWSARHQAWNASDYCNKPYCSIKVLAYSEEPIDDLQKQLKEWVDDTERNDTEVH